MAARWYEARGYDVIDRNWRCRNGEIDLVLRQGRTTVFCEVKTRSSAAYGTPAEAVTRTKQLRLRQLASAWIEAHPGRRGPIRFDVAAILAGHIDVIEAAF